MIVLLTIGTAWLMAQKIIPFANINWDEAGSFLWTDRVVQALQTHNGQLGQIALNQFYYLPGYSFAIGIPLSFIGFSIKNARILGLSFFILGSLFLFYLGVLMDKTQGKWIGFISGLLFLTSPMMLLFGSLGMKEMISTTLSIAVVICYVLAREKKSIVLFFFTGFLLFVTSMTRYHPALLLGAGIVCEMVVSFLLSKKERIRIVLTHCLVMLTYGGLTSLWIFFPTNKWGWLLSILGNQWEYTSDFAKPFSQAALLFYPRSILLMYSLSPIIGVALLVSLIIGLFFWKDYKLRILWFPIVLNMMYGAYHVLNMEERFIFSVVPLLFVFGTTIYIKIGKFFFHNRYKYPQMGTLLGVLILGSFFVGHDALNQWNKVYAVGAYVFKSPLFNQTDYKDLWFNYDTSQWSWNLPPKTNSLPSELMDFTISNVDPNKSLKIFGLSNEFSEWYYDLKIALAQQKKIPSTLPYAYYIIILRINPTSRFYTRDNMLYDTIRHKENVPPKVPYGNWLLINSRKFPDLGIDTEIYGVLQ